MANCGDSILSKRNAVVARATVSCGEVEPVVVGERPPGALVGADVGGELADVELAGERLVARQHGDLRDRPAGSRSG